MNIKKDSKNPKKSTQPGIFDLSNAAKSASLWRLFSTASPRSRHQLAALGARAILRFRSRRSCCSPSRQLLKRRFCQDGAASVLAAIILGAAVQQAFAAQITINTQLPQLDVGIVVAVLGEFQALYKHLDPNPAPYNVTKFGRTFAIGALSGRSVVVVACGIGMTNSAMTTQMLLDTFDVKYLIFQGVAGGVNPELRVGDVVVPKSWFNIHHQKLIRSVPTKKSKPTSTFYEVGRDFPNKFVTKSGLPISLTAPLAQLRGANPAEITALSAIPGVGFYEGFAIPMETEVLINPNDVFQDFPPTKFYMPVSTTLWNIAKQVEADNNITLFRSALINGQVKDLGYQPKLVVSSDPGASSSTFLDNAEYRQALFTLFRAQAFEMEGAAFMHVCTSAAKECLVIRALSDLAGGDADFANVVQVFLSFASQNTASVTKAILAKLPKA